MSLREIEVVRWFKCLNFWCRVIFGAGGVEFSRWVVVWAVFEDLGIGYEGDVGR